MSAGRHRSYNMNIALDKAMEIFWTNGYPGTSLADLTQAMGINKSSLYAAFGNKEALFKTALELYVEKYGMSHVKKLTIPDKSLNARIKNYLASIAKMVSDKNLPGGCLVCLSTSEVGGNCLPTGAMQAVSKINSLTSSYLIDFFKHEKSTGNISSNDTPKVLANYVMALQFGLAVLARNGADYRELNNIINYATDRFNSTTMD